MSLEVGPGSEGDLYSTPPQSSQRPGAYGDVDCGYFEPRASAASSGVYYDVSEAGTARASVPQSDVSGTYYEVSEAGEAPSSAVGHGAHVYGDTYHGELYVYGLKDEAGFEEPGYDTVAVTASRPGAGSTYDEVPARPAEGRQDTSVVYGEASASVPTPYASVRLPGRLDSITQHDVEEPPVGRGAPADSCI